MRGARRERETERERERDGLPESSCQQSQDGVSFYNHCAREPKWSLVLEKGESEMGGGGGGGERDKERERGRERGREREREREREGEIDPVMHGGILQRESHLVFRANECKHEH